MLKKIYKILLHFSSISFTVTFFEKIGLHNINFTSMFPPNSFILCSLNCKFWLSYFFPVQQAIIDKKILSRSRMKFIRVHYFKSDPKPLAEFKTENFTDSHYFLRVSTIQLNFMRIKLNFA